MAVVVEYQAWDSASYNWLDNTTSTSAPLQINDKLDAWVSAVNANASNTNKQITVEKDPSDSTSTNFVGWVLKLASNSSSATTYVRFTTTATTLISIGDHDTWTAGTSNGGYGTFGGTNASTVSTTFYTSGKTAEFIVATETADAEEFFCLGWRTDSANNSTGSGGLVIFKDTAGEWAVYFTSDGFNYGSFYMPTHTSPTRNYGLTLLNYSVTTSALAPFGVRVSSSTYLPAAGNATTVACVPKSPYLLLSGSTSVAYQFARYAALPSSRTAVCMGYSPLFVSYA